MSNTVWACPECDEPKVQPRQGEPWADDTDADYYCSDCGAYFDEPAERESNRHGDGGSELKRKLLQTNTEVHHD